MNGFLPNARGGAGNQSTAFPPTNRQALAPHEVVLRRTHAPTKVPLDFYAADERLPPDLQLPDSDLLKAVHAYTSDFYASTTDDRGRGDFRSLDETALLAMGILLEEAAVEALGETGDMVLVEPEGLENGLPEDRMVRHQVKGRVRPVATPSPAQSEEEESDVDVEEDLGRNRKRARYGYF